MAVGPDCDIDLADDGGAGDEVGVTPEATNWTWRGHHEVGKNWN